MRVLIHDAVEWHVQEVDAGKVPGSRSTRCLIFDSEGIVRRVWEYPSSWAELSDDALWEIIHTSSSHASRPPSGSHPAVAAATESAVRSRVLLSELALARETNRALRDEQEALLRACQRSREEMRIAVESYAGVLKSIGVPPERAVLLIKSAMKVGIEATSSFDSDAERLFREGVTWGIGAYFAA
jgi:hypothetical protein